SRPSMDPARRRTEPPLTGDPPNPINPPSGCRFRTRCPFATPLCAEQTPPLREIAPHHFAACHYAESLDGQTDRRTVERVLRTED
ncbi:MAG TPA: oligopeptide/dipeptide ABC transporter ATP-binding protein, partial [Thermomicrobiales bacterium]